MRTFVRVLVAVVLVGATALLAPPAAASHDSMCDGCPYDPSSHETQPAALVASPHSTCVVAGGVSTDADGDAFDGNEETLGGPQHTLLEGDDPLLGNPAHDHYVFTETVIACAGQIVEVFDVRADGGSDGHLVDLIAPAAHPFNPDHGAVDESAWSHSSQYSGDKVTTPPAPNCGSVDVKNKGDIRASSTLRSPLPAPNLGWVKYLRVGPIVHAWGCFQVGGDAGTHFSADLVFTPTAVPTDFLLNGTAVLGRGWLAVSIRAED